jgi:hypothetical protein
MGYYFITGGKYGWVLGHSTSGQVFGLPFGSYIEAKHFAGFWITSQKKSDIEFDDAYVKWYDKYFDEEEEDFIGDVNEWKYKDLSLELIKSEEKKLVTKTPMTKRM